MEPIHIPATLVIMPNDQMTIDMRAEAIIMDCPQCLVLVRKVSLDAHYKAAHPAHKTGEAS